MTEEYATKNDIATINQTITAMGQTITAHIIATVVAQVTKVMDERFAKQDQFLEEFARMVQRGFTEQARIFNEFRDEMLDFKKDTNQSLFNIKSDITSITSDIREIRSDIKNTNRRVDALVSLYRGHEGRIVALENALPA